MRQLMRLPLLLLLALSGCGGNTSPAYGPVQVGMSREALLKSGLTEFKYNTMLVSQRYRMEMVLGMRYHLAQPTAPCTRLEAFVKADQVVYLMAEESHQDAAAAEASLIGRHGQPSRRIVCEPTKTVVLFWGQTDQVQTNSLGVTDFMTKGPIIQATLTTGRVRLNMFLSEHWEKNKTAVFM